LFKGRDKKKSSLVIGDGARNSSQSNTNSSILVYLADSKVSIHFISLC
jgi:hypothetical protein